MLDREAGHPIEKDLRGLGSVQRAYPILEPRRKSFFEKFKNIVPTHRVKILPNV
jgi:hypothetical protein